MYAVRTLRRRLVIGMVVNCSMALHLPNEILHDRPLSDYLAALADSASEMLFNYLGNRDVVCRSGTSESPEVVLLNEKTFSRPPCFE